MLRTILLLTLLWPAAGQAASTADAEMEAFLADAAVVSAKEIGSGVTRPLKLELEMDGRTGKAAFKTVDIYESGVKRHAARGFEQNFDDSYRYDRAAYLLDRRLGLGMVPVTVLRHYDGRDGAAIEWISGAVDEEARREQGLEAPDPQAFRRQRSAMALFDALIHNDDRNLGNQLITTADWRLHLIDHSRSFRLGLDLSQAFRVGQTQVPRTVYERLQELEMGELQELLGELVTRPRLKALLERRDKIVEKVEADRRELGDRFVFAD
jgi:hypothetical protein